MKLCSGRWYQGVKPPLQLERAATMGRTGIRSRGPGNLLADFYNKIGTELPIGKARVWSAENRGYSGPKRDASSNAFLVAALFPISTGRTGP